MKKKLQWHRHLWTALCFLFLSLAFAQAKANPYQVVKVIDGDTILATDGNIKFKVRIVGMDAPEKEQPLGKLATNRLSALIADKTVTITPLKSGLDQYGRVLGFVFVDGKSLAETMIVEGLAFYYRPTCKDYPEDKKNYDYDPLPFVAAENVAKNLKRNLWAAEPMQLPCDWRKNKKLESH